MRRSLLLPMSGGVLWMLIGAACSDGAVVRKNPPLPSDGGEGGQGPSGGGTANQGGSAPIPTGKGVGEACSTDDACRVGLSCNADDECEPSGATEPGGACVLSAECQDGQCIAGKCAPAGEGKAGAACFNGDECAAGLRCALKGLSAVCVPEGSGDVGAECTLSTECFAGLSCLAGACAPSVVGVPPFLSGEPWKGATCDPPATSGIKAYFEVPGAKGADEGDFFRLPFPSDVRKHGNKLDLSDFPTPGAALLGVDPVQLYVDAVEANDSGWGAYPTVIFRFSGAFDGDTLPPNQSLKFVDLTAKREVGWQRFYTPARTAYVCENFIGVQPPSGSPLEPEHTYAVYLLSTVTVDKKPMTLLAEDDTTTCDSDADCDSGVCAVHDTGNHCEIPVAASENMAAVLAETAPGDKTLAAAHAAFAPLREYLSTLDPAVDADNVLTATVFTVGNVRAAMTELADATAQAAAPVASDWVKCKDGAQSPCDQAEGDRACGDDVAGYDEYHALLSLPIYQQGEEPYLTPDDGGDIDVSKPRTEQVCLSITVPEGTPPAAGWPAVVFAHGTGGSFRDHVSDAVAGSLAAATPKFAVIGIDQVEHGPRRGKSTESPNNLFFNFLNPAVTRGNPLQGAADQLGVARFAKTLDVAASVTHGSAIKLDATQLFFFGHSQGSTEGSLMLPFADDFRAAVLSGNGASLRDALRTKTKPENIAGSLPYVLQDPMMSDPNIGVGITAFHPVLSLLQQWIDPADPLNFAALLATPPAMHTAKHVFQTFGLDDSYSPPITMATFAKAGGFVEVSPDASAKKPFDELRLSAVAAPYAAEDKAFTLGMRQYGAAKNSDGHFVVFDNPVAHNDMLRFFMTATSTTPPTIGE